jgi:predicted regulator of Ras-like GTPase activity (Roadblock/LC7/MglB family)
VEGPVAVAVAEDWVRAPLKRFVDDGRLLLAILLRADGQVLGQHGFSRSVDVMSACALAAGIYASAGEVGRMLEGKPFHVIHHVGTERQLFMAPAQTQRGSLLVLAVFDAESSLGLVQLYHGELAAALAAMVPEQEPEGPVLADAFEVELNRNLAALFGRA